LFLLGAAAADEARCFIAFCGEGVDFVGVVFGVLVCVTNFSFPARAVGCLLLLLDLALEEEVGTTPIPATWRVPAAFFALRKAFCFAATTLLVAVAADIEGGRGEVIVLGEAKCATVECTPMGKSREGGMLATPSCVIMVPGKEKTLRTRKTGRRQNDSRVEKHAPLKHVDVSASRSKTT